MNRLRESVANPGAIRLRHRRIASCAVLLACVAAPAQPAAILGAAYDLRGDELVVDIAYRGTTGAHDFILQWDECRVNEAGKLTASARLIDTRGDEIAQQDFLVRERYRVTALGCRPADLTLRLGPVSHVTLHIPAEPRERSNHQAR